MVGSDTKVNSGVGVAWLDDASMNRGRRRKSNLMSPPLDTVEVKWTVVVREQCGDCVEPSPKNKSGYES